MAAAAAGKFVAYAALAGSGDDRDCSDTYLAREFARTAVGRGAGWAEPHTEQKAEYDAATCPPQE